MGKSTEPLKTRQYVTAETLTVLLSDDTEGAARKTLALNKIAIFRVVVLVTLKMAILLISNYLSDAHHVSCGIGVGLLR